MRNKEKIQKIKELLDELEWDKKSSIPMTSEEIQEMERELNVILPEEYKEFLRIFGCLRVEGHEILGKGIRWYLSASKATLSLRKAYPGSPKKPEFPKFPENVVVVEEDGFGNAYCVVCGGKDHGKVIFWQHDVYPGQEYPNYPPDKGPDFWIEGPDFWTWLLNGLQRIEEVRESQAKEKGGGYRWKT